MNVDSMSSKQKRELLCSDPVTIARHFSQRFQKFIAFMKSSSKSMITFCELRGSRNGGPSLEKKNVYKCQFCRKVAQSFDHDKIWWMWLKNW